MHIAHLWSLRLGFSSKQAATIEQMGLKSFLNRSFNHQTDHSIPDFIQDEPHTLAELKEIREKIKDADEKEKKKMLKKQIMNHQELKKWWLDKMINETFPLREKMIVFWHNHFVSSAQKVKVNYWIFQHHQVLRAHAFGNFKTLTKKIIQTNAMVRYLDNVDNKVGAINENLSRELLELFTLGIGNYTENDIKEGAKALAGLNLGETSAEYRKRQEVNESITYLGKKGEFKADDLVDIIFEQPALPYLITRKMLQWFLYDQPDETLVKTYGDYFRSQNFEIQPLLTKMFTEAYEKNISGTKIKDPLLYILQLTDALQVKPLQKEVVLGFLRQQGMDLFNPPNVKGWIGGNAWLSSQVYLQRNKASDLLCSGKSLRLKGIKNDDEVEFEISPIDISLDWNHQAKPNEIIRDLAARFLFQTSEEIQKDMEQILKYDFDPKSENAEASVLRLFNYITKTPEFQIL